MASVPTRAPARTVCVCALVYATHHGLELLSGPGLKVAGVAGGDEMLHALLPLDRFAQLTLEQRLDLVHGCVRHAGHVGVDLARGRCLLGACKEWTWQEVAC